MSMNIFFLQHVISTLILWKKNETLLHKATSGDESASLHRMAPPDTPDHGCIARTPMGNCLTDPPCTIALDLVYSPSTSRRWAAAGPSLRRQWLAPTINRRRATAPSVVPAMPTSALGGPPCGAPSLFSSSEATVSATLQWQCFLDGQRRRWDWAHGHPVVVAALVP
jgi:hypothetical protein